MRDHAAMLVPPSRAAALSGREREVVALIAEGMSSAGIAQRVVLSSLTVETYASHAMTKAGARTAPDWWSWPVYGLAALPTRDDEITSSTRARQSSR